MASSPDQSDAHLPEPALPPSGLRDPLIRATDRGLYCRDGDFYIDPWRTGGTSGTPGTPGTPGTESPAIARAIITHAHSDHAAPGCGSYLASPTCVPLLRARLGASIAAESLAWGERRRIGDVIVSLHPAGHVLGSAQIRVEPLRATSDNGGVWVVSGDYFHREPGADRAAPRPGAEPFEPVACDTFLTESTFGLPIYRWPADGDVFAAINAWWRGNAARGVTSVLYAYSLGKAQRVLLGVDPSIGPIAAHGSVLAMNAVYRECGVALPECRPIVRETLPDLKGRALVIAPPSAGGNAAWLRKLAGPAGSHGIDEAMASGWMRVRGKRRWRSVATGFTLSDHADWPGLLAAIRATGASRVGVTHGSSAALARWLSERGTPAFIVPTRYEGEADTSEGAPEGGDA